MMLHGTAQVHARPGEEYGILWGYAIVREHATPVYYDEAKTKLSHVEYSGRPLVDVNGFYIRSNARTKLGNVYPDWFGGVTNSFSYKNLNLSFLVDFKKGGVVYSVTDWFGTQAGVLAKTAAINDKGHNIRDDVADGGGIRADGVYGKVNADGTISFLDASGNVVSTPVENQVILLHRTFTTITGERMKCRCLMQVLLNSVKYLLAIL